MKRAIILLSVEILFAVYCFSQQTYQVGDTEYYINQYYSTTGKPKVKRNSSNKSEYLKSIGYDKIPYGYEVDHIIPLSKGGTDDIYNMQLLDSKQHALKTVYERSQNLMTTFSSYSSFNTLPTINTNDIINSLPKSNRRKIKSNGSNIFNNYYKSSSISQPSINNSLNIKTGSPKIIHTGSRGGKYYINSNGNKTYIKKYDYPQSVLIKK